MRSSDWSSDLCSSDLEESRDGKHTLRTCEGIVELTDTQDVPPQHLYPGVLEQITDRFRRAQGIVVEQGDLFRAARQQYFSDVRSDQADPAGDGEPASRNFHDLGPVSVILENGLNLEE